MATDTNKFVEKHNKKLHIKYLRKSVTALFNRDIAADDYESLDAIQDQFSRYIVTPIHK